jgi:uncharacterized protein (TIGR02466 family)
MSQNDSFHFFPSPFVYHYEVPEHDVIGAELKSKLNKFYDSYHTNEQYTWNASKVNSSEMCTNFHHSQKHNRWYTDYDLECIIWNPLDKLLLHLKNGNAKCVLKDIWWNVYQKGDYASWHNHGNFGISGLYLLELNEPNKTIFTYQDHYMTKLASDTEYYRTPDVKEGTVLLFPSALYHYVDPSEERRMSISFNVEIS